MIGKVRSALVAACLAGGAALAAPEDTGKAEAARDESVARWVVDLRTGEQQGDGPIKVVARGPCRMNAALQAVVVKVDLTGLAGLRVRASYGVAPTGLTLHVGDSSSNNGFAGDGCTQSRDAEAHVSDAALLVWGSDHTPAQERKGGSTGLRTVDGLVGAGTELVLTVRDEALAWELPALGRREGLRSSGLFALAGQPDTEGPVNHDVFVAANRCIAGDYRAGSGVTRLVLEPLTR